MLDCSQFRLAVAKDAAGPVGEMIATILENYGPIPWESVRSGMIRDRDAMRERLDELWELNLNHFEPEHRVKERRFYSRILPKIEGLIQTMDEGGPDEHRE